MSTEEILAALLALPRPERARVAHDLLASLEEADEDAIATEWAGELERRAREVAEGKVETIAWSTVREQIQGDLEQRRARRAAS